MRLTVNEIVEATNGTLLYKNKDSVVCGVSTDSRENLSQKLFIPIKGENFDGHNFINNAVLNGASGYLTHIKEEKEDVCDKADFAVLVEDTKKALGMLSKYVLKRSGAKVIGVTGSVGKTTTRQLIASVVSELGKTLVTLKNFNNDIGLPLTILSMDGDEKYAVLEMGMNNLGEISYLSKIASPNIAVITMIGMSHIEHLKTQENILKAKLEITDGMDENGVLVLSGDDSMLSNLKGKLKQKTVYFGIENGDFEVSVTDCDEKCEFSFDNEKYTVNVSGIHNVKNACCAVTVGKLLGADYKTIQRGFDKFKNISLRQEMYKIGSKDIILDCYNASLDSMRAALGVLKNKKGGRKVAILGAIGELGDYLSDILTKVGEAVYENEVDLLVTCDENSSYIREGAIKAGFRREKTLHFETKNELFKNIGNVFKDGDCVLIKASRAYKFEEIFEKMKESEE